MFPWGHAAVAYLLYSTYSRRRLDGPPSPRAALAVGLGAMFADLVDKPLGWGLGVLPSRSLGHSLLFAVPLVAAVYVAAYAYDRVSLATAFSMAHLTHLVTDLRPRLLLGYPIRSGYLLWPLVSRPVFTYREQVFEPPAVVVLLVTPLTHRPTYMLLEAVLFVVALWRWDADGRPGLEYVRSRGGGGR